jgi:hypothetical protein
MAVRHDAQLTDLRVPAISAFEIASPCGPSVSGEARALPEPQEDRNARSSMPGVSFSSCQREATPFGSRRFRFAAKEVVYFFLATFRFLATFFLATFFLATFLTTFFFAFFLATFRPPNTCSGRDHSRPSGWGRNASTVSRHHNETNRTKPQASSSAFPTEPSCGCPANSYLPMAP